MGVDWITVTAQIVNFLVLVWLLQRFLYGPITRAMDERDARIADKLRDAQERKLQAESEANRYQELQLELEKHREARLAKVQDEAEDLRRSLLSTSRAEVADQRSAWLRNLVEEKADFLADIKERAAEAFATMSRRAFDDLANEKLEDQISRRFVRVLRDLDEPNRKKIRAACQRQGRTVVVRTAFDLNTRRRNQIGDALRDVAGTELAIAFERTSDLICGVELRAGSQSVRWSLDSFLDELEAELRDVVERRAPDADWQTREQAD